MANQALILARPGRNRDGLYALLDAIQRGLAPLTTEDPAHALAACEQRQINLILVDSQELHQDWRTLLAAIRQIHPKITCLVIVRSQEERVAALKAGADAVITPGSSCEQLSRVIQSFTATAFQDETR